MTTITRLANTMNTIIEESEHTIEQSESCISSLHSQIAEKHNWILWNRGRIDTAEELLEQIEHEQKSAIMEIKR